MIKFIRNGVFLLALGLFLQKIIVNTVSGALLTGKSPEIKAVIIDEKKFYGNSPVSQKFSYSYLFKIGDKVYKGNSMESKFKIGDTILIRYLKSNPDVNESVDYYHK